MFGREANHRFHPSVLSKERAVLRGGHRDACEPQTGVWAAATHVPPLVRSKGERTWGQHVAAPKALGENQICFL